MSPITDVFFDLDHTLWDFERNSALAFRSIFDKHNVAVCIDDFLLHYVPINLRYWNAYRDDKISREALRYGRFKEAFDAVHFDADDTLIAVLSDQYIEHLPLHNNLFEGAIETLDYLRAKYRLHIITNGFAAVQGLKMQNSGLSGYFETVTDSEMAGVKKPHPQIFQYAIDKAQTQKQQSIMIGDCIDADVRGALNFGMDAILFGAAVQVPENIKHIAHLSELKNHL